MKTNDRIGGQERGRNFMRYENLEDLVYKEYGNIIAYTYKGSYYCVNCTRWMFHNGIEIVSEDSYGNAVVPVYGDGGIKAHRWARLCPSTLECLTPSHYYYKSEGKVGKTR